MEFLDAKNYKKEIKKLYRTAFPKNERAPLFLLFKRTNNGRDSFYAVSDNKEFVGLIYTISTRKLTYVFFLAVKEEMRGKGYGSKILDKIKKDSVNKTVILMIEDTEKEDCDNIKERLERLRFYEKNGFKKLMIKINEAGVDYELLGTELNVTQADFLNLMKDYVGSLLFKYLYRKTILSQQDK